MKYSIFKIWLLYIKSLFRLGRHEKFRELPILAKVIIVPYLFFYFLFNLPKKMLWLYRNRKKINKEINKSYKLRMLELITDLKSILPGIDDKIASKWSNGIAYGMTSLVLNDLLPKFREISEKLLTQGWFLNPYLKIPVADKAADDLITDEYNIRLLEANFEDIEQLLVGRFPERKQFLKRGFELHRKGDYISSIPVMIMQIDGIFRTLTQKELFSTNKGRKASVWLDDLEASGRQGIAHAILDPLRQDIYFGSNFQKALEFPAMISRNRILHGDDLSYHTLTNSFKVISLLLYICSFVYDAIFKSESTPSFNELKDFLNNLQQKL